MGALAVSNSDFGRLYRETVHSRDAGRLDGMQVADVAGGSLILTDDREILLTLAVSAVVCDGRIVVPGEN